MPSFLAEDPDHTSFASSFSSYNHNARLSVDKPTPLGDAVPGGWSNGSAIQTNGVLFDGTNGSKLSLRQGIGQASERSQARNRTSSRNGSMRSVETGRNSGVENERRPVNIVKATQEWGARDDGYFAAAQSGTVTESEGLTSTHVTLGALPDSVTGVEPDSVLPPVVSSVIPKAGLSSPAGNRTASGRVTSSAPDSSLRVPTSVHRASSPPAFSQSTTTMAVSSTPSPQPQPPGRLQQRHTLEVPTLSASRTSKELHLPNPRGPDDAVFASGRFSPNTPTRRRGSSTLARRTTRSIHSDMHLDEVPQDEDAVRWAEHIRQKRASKRRRIDGEDDDRVVVGTKVDQNHVNWVTAYNMLTGIRFTVSRTNAKVDRDLTDADFDARHKFSFDITGNELTPSAKYDFKFKDYAPWVFRHLRSNFRLDPADYLMSLTSKYILSELGSPGKSGSFFYFSRDYKYIIKTIHHAEHKFLRKILREYYNHVKANPNTLLSQFYGLHRVKIPYGRKIHFVIMNNLFPPHRDIHRTFDLKGSTIGREFKEEDLEKNPRATLKDLNWLNRNLHLEFGPTKKQAFIEQMKRDVALLKRLKIMDYSLLVGIHDLERGNEENLRDKTLKVFQPGGEAAEEPLPTPLMRTPSKLENARKAKELRQIIKNQKPIPMDQSTSKMPDEMEDDGRGGLYFYSDDGGFRATHEDDRPGEEIYYLGIIDCLTHYGFVKRAEHFFKGLSNPESQISAIPPERYGDRFVRFISGITKSREKAEQEKNGEGIDDPRLSGVNLGHAATNEVMEKAEKQAEKSRRYGTGQQEDDIPDRRISAVRSPSAERGELLGATLPVIGEAAENGSTGGKSVNSRNASVTPQASKEQLTNGPTVRSTDTPDQSVDEVPPPTPAKHLHTMPGGWIDGAMDDAPPPTPPKDVRRVLEERPPTPPKDGYITSNESPSTPVKADRGRSREKALPSPPTVLDHYDASPPGANPSEMEALRRGIAGLST
ncbi:hypothetical protein B0A49_02187 [Cryomyces minteri]|uniref:1-phosphatidylinositol-4-phosphate 5-kinase n=1 Tax=Cryomyces minteri TaxID=331657 RepID=A0A4U0XDZ4_9PEZI|nr:hypothetical protein B0A49_02187 [Cryomyces minteri]